MRLRIRFSEPIPKDLTVLVISDYSALMEISKDGSIKTSYTPK